MANKKVKEVKEVKKSEKQPKEVNLKSEKYNHDNELIERREDTETSDSVMWGFVIGFALFFVLLIMIICFTH